MFGWFPLRPLDFRSFNLRRNCASHAGCDFVLQLKDIIQRAVKPISPKMCASSGLDKLAGDTDLAARLPDATFEHVPNAQLSSNLLDINRFAFVREARV